MGTFLLIVVPYNKCLMDGETIYYICFCENIYAWKNLNSDIYAPLRECRCVRAN